MRKIAIIDDVLLNARLVQAITKQLDDTESKTFTNPIEGLEWCRKNYPDLILLDYQMPEMNGIEFLKEFRKYDRFADIPVVIITGEDKKEVLHEALAAGATDFLRKPIDDIELLARARNMLRLRDRQLELTAAYEKLEAQANTDALTGLLNRRRFLQGFEDEFGRSRRYRHPLSVAMIDVDHFKKINDTHGHGPGDKVLATLAEIMIRELRGVDSVGRLGGEEFAAYFPETDIVGAALACERMRVAVGESSIELADQRVSVTISIGVTQIRPGSDGPASFLKRADDLLYKAKSAGRNCVETDLADREEDGDPPEASPELAAAGASLRK